MTSDMLSQEEIDALLGANNVDNENNNNASSSEYLNDTEKDTLGEIGNISMGTAATTLFTLLGQKVIITTPKVSITDVDMLSSEYHIPFVAVDVKYKLGLKGANLLILKCDDVKVITDLMMGGDGTNIDREVNEMDLSAISEAMNQMVGSSCTSLSEMFSQKIDIDPPRAFKINFFDGKDTLDVLKIDEPIIKVSFKMIVGDLIDSEMMQLLPLSFAKKITSWLLNNAENQDERIEHNSSEHETLESISNSKKQAVYENHENKKKISDDIDKNTVNVKSASFVSFDDNENKMYNEGIELVKEIPIEVSAELGRTTKKIGEILEYGPGTIVELDKLVGEPLEVFANGKFIAKGEVVVIDDNFGIRITDIISPSKRINKF